MVAGARCGESAGRAAAPRRRPRRAPPAPVAGPAAAAARQPPWSSGADRAAQRAARRRGGSAAHARFLARRRRAPPVLLSSPWRLAWSLGRGRMTDGGRDRPTPAPPAAAAPCSCRSPAPTGRPRRAPCSAYGPTRSAAAAVLVPSRLIVDVAGSGQPAVRRDRRRCRTSRAGKGPDRPPRRVGRRRLGAHPGGAGRPGGRGGRRAGRGRRRRRRPRGGRQRDGRRAAGHPAARRRGGRRLRDLPRRGRARAGAAGALLRRPRRRARALPDGPAGGRRQRWPRLGDGSTTTLDDAWLGPSILAARSAVAAEGDLLSDVLPVNRDRHRSGRGVLRHRRPAGRGADGGALPGVAGEGRRRRGASGCSSQNGVGHAWAGGQGSPHAAGRRRLPVRQRRQRGRVRPRRARCSSPTGPSRASSAGAAGRGVAGAARRASVSVSGQGQTVAEVIVVLGRGFRPEPGP